MHSLDPVSSVMILDTAWCAVQAAVAYETLQKETQTKTDDTHASITDRVTTKAKLGAKPLPMPKPFQGAVSGTAFHISRRLGNPSVFHAKADRPRSSQWLVLKTCSVGTAA